MEIITGKISLKAILQVYWIPFVKKYHKRIRSVVHENVKKILQCKTKKMGYGTYECLECGEKKTVAFTCKSRSCSSCGKVACDNWMNGVISWSLPEMKYRHIVFTIPEELREFILLRRKDSLDILFRAATAALLYVFQKKYNCKPGIISVMHTFGGDIKWNPHVHVIITNGGLSCDLQSWNFHEFIPYRLLNESWKYYMIQELRKWARNNVKKNFGCFNAGLNNLYHKKWYVNVGKVLDSLEFTIRYIGRYAKRPVVAETRLLGIEDENIRFSFKDKKVAKEKIITMSIEEFIGKLIRHIPEKFHRMIRYSGLFANRIKSKMLLIVNNLISNGKMKLVYLTKPPLTWRERMKKITGIDPLACASCQRIMELVNITICKRDGSFHIIDFSP